MRTKVLAVGLCATALITLAGMLLFIGTLYDHKAAIGVVLTGGAIAGPLFGTIAASYEQRWNPLLMGCGFGLLSLFVMFALIG